MLYQLSYRGHGGCTKLNVLTNSQKYKIPFGSIELKVDYLGLGQVERGRQFDSLRRGEVALGLEPPLKPGQLVIGEHSPGFPAPALLRRLRREQ